MKEVILKSDLEKAIMDELKWWHNQWLPSDLYRGGAEEALNRLYRKLIFGTHSDLKGGDNNGYGK